jgi:hypothetical protein
LSVALISDNTFIEGNLILFCFRDFFTVNEVKRIYLLFSRCENLGACLAFSWTPSGEEFVEAV